MESWCQGVIPNCTLLLFFVNNCYGYDTEKGGIAEPTLHVSVYTFLSIFMCVHLVFLRRGDTCYQAMHVGCAIWKRGERGEWPQLRHVYFFPSPTNDSYTKPLANAFCPAHAEDLKKHHVHGWNWLRYPGVQGAVADHTAALSTQTARARSSSISPNGTGSNRTSSHRSLTVAMHPGQKKVAPVQPTRGLGIGGGRMARHNNALSNVGRPTGGGSTKRSSSLISGFSGPMKTASAAEGRPSKIRRRVFDSEALKANAASAVATARPRTSFVIPTSHQVPKTVAVAPSIRNHEDLIQEMVDDVTNSVNKFKHDGQERTRRMVARMKFWKRNSDLSSNEFHEIWPRVKALVLEELGLSSQSRDVNEKVPRKSDWKEKKKKVPGISALKDKDRELPGKSKLKEKDKDQPGKLPDAESDDVLLIETTDKDNTQSEVPPQNHHDPTQDLIDEMIQDMADNCFTPELDGEENEELKRLKFMERKKYWRAKLSLPKSEFKELWRHVLGAFRDHVHFEAPNKMTAPAESDPAHDVRHRNDLVDELKIGNGNGDTDNIEAQQLGETRVPSRADEGIVDNSSDVNNQVLQATHNVSGKNTDSLEMRGPGMEENQENTSAQARKDGQRSDNRNDLHRCNGNDEEALFNQIFSGVLHKFSKLPVKDQSTVSFVLTGLKNEWDIEVGREMIERIWPRVERAVKMELGIEMPTCFPSSHVRPVPHTSTPSHKQRLSQISEFKTESPTKSSKGDVLYARVLNDVKRKIINGQGDLESILLEAESKWNYRLKCAGVKAKVFFAKVREAASNVEPVEQPSRTRAMSTSSKLPKRVLSGPVGDRVSPAGHAQAMIVPLAAESTLPVIRELLDDVSESSNPASKPVEMSYGEGEGKRGSTSNWVELSRAPEADENAEDSIVQKKGTDWSFLVVGKGYDPSRWKFDTWDTEEYITNEEMLESMELHL